MIRMEKNISECSSAAPLPLAALRLLVPPLRLVSAAVWQTIQQKIVADYGMLEEFVSMVTDIVPELLTSQQRAELGLGLRAQLILELCQPDAPADFDIIQPHLDRMQVLIDAWLMEAGGTNIELPQSNFVDVVKSLLNDPEERRHFFELVFLHVVMFARALQSVVPVEFGPEYSHTLHTLMRLFLSRLETFLPLQTFQQVASMLGENCVLEDCLQLVSQCEELTTLLHYQKQLSQLDHVDTSLGGELIISALKLPRMEKSELLKTQARDSFVDELLCSSDLEKESLTLVPQQQTLETNDGQTARTPGHHGAPLLLGYSTRQEENETLQSEAEGSCHLMKECRVHLRRLDLPLSLQSRPVRAKRGLRMKRILQEEKRGLWDEALPAYKARSRKTKPSNKVSRMLSDNEDSGKDSSYMAPISTCSDDDSWSYYSDEDSCHNTASRSPSMTDSWSHYSDEELSGVTPVSSSPQSDLFNSSSNEDPSFLGAEDASVSRRTLDTGKIKPSSPKQTRQIQCFICKERLSTSLRIHMKIHFPTNDYACPRCDSRFKLLTSLKNHLNKTCYEYGQQHVDPENLDEVKNLYRCEKCEEAFRYKVSLQRHTLTHNDLYCSVCRKVLRDSATLARHKASHTLFECSRCDEAFTLFKPLLRHYENVHEVSRPFKCSRCPKTVSKLRSLIIHEWHHTGHLPFQCTQCSLRFKCDAELMYHERVHTREKPYLCAECGKTFAHRSNLLRHLNFIHGESRNEKKHSCSQCEKSFKEKGALKKHQRSKHLKELFRSPCPSCGKMVAASTMKRHQLIHSGERPFKCTVSDCEKYYRSTSEVKRHVLIHHSTERPYKCDICGKGFVKMCYLRLHAKIHSGEKPFICNICGKAFPKAYSMLRHKKLLHTFVPH